MSVRSDTSYFQGTELMLARTLTERVVTGNYIRPRPHPLQGVPVQLSRPSVGQYVLGPLFNHDARWHRY